MHIFIYHHNIPFFRGDSMVKRNVAKTGDFLIRIVAGLIFIVSGYGKLTNIEATSGFIASLNFPIPTILAVLAGFIEFFGGLLLLLGLWTFIPATLLAIEMAIVIVFVHLQQGWAALRLPILMFAVMIRYMGTSGCCSILRRRRRHS